MKASLILGLACCWALHPVAAQHLHCNVGATAQVQDAPLFFQNGGDFSTNSRFALTLESDTNVYAGYFQSGALSFTAIGDGFFDNPLNGTQVRLRFVSVTGPAGGSVGIWDVPGFNPNGDNSTTLTFSVPVGTHDGTNSLLLSENFGEPGADPFGHIHGRHFSATRPGLYVIWVQAYDAATNGVEGRPLHTPSNLLPIYFRAGDMLVEFMNAPDSASGTFGTKAGYTYQVEAAAALDGLNSWHPVGDPVAGNDHLQTFVDPAPNPIKGFYRLHVTPP